jgi:hypothetical protein
VESKNNFIVVYNEIPDTVQTNAVLCSVCVCVCVCCLCGWCGSNFFFLKTQQTQTTPFAFLVFFHSQFLQNLDGRERLSLIMNDDVCVLYGGSYLFLATA